MIRCVLFFSVADNSYLYHCTLFFGGWVLGNIKTDFGGLFFGNLLSCASVTAFATQTLLFFSVNR